MPVNLTRNSLAAIMNGDVNLKPLVQVTNLQQIGANQSRYRLSISDSVSTQQALLGSQLTDRVKSGDLRCGSVIQLIDYTCNNVQNRRVIYILNLEIIIPECEIIGNPPPLPVADYNVGNALPNNSSAYPARLGNANVSTQCTSNNLQNFKPPIQSAFQQQAGVQRTGNIVQNFRPTIQPAYQPSPIFKNHGPIVKNEAPSRILPIAALNPYQGRWAIKARVTAKGDLRRYNNAKGDGKVFSFDLLDSEGGEIRVTCFNAVVDRFYDVIEVGKVYLISKGSLKPAQKNFNHLRNDWEIFLEATSIVDLCPDEDVTIPQQKFNFRPICEIETAENNAIFDIIGVVIAVNPSVPIVRKNGMETQRRIINLKDTSGKSVELTLWGEFCNREGQQLQELFDSGDFPVVAVKAAKVNDFSGKSVGTISTTQLFINPVFPEAHKLAEWFHRGGKDVVAQSISRDNLPLGGKNETRKTLSQIKDEGLGRSERPDWITVKATISFIKTDNFCYTACPLMVGDRQCNKKVTKSGSMWVCDRCSQEFEECDYRYLLQAQIQDHSGVTWVTAFQESGEEILGCPAKELYTLKYELEDDEKFAEIIRNSLFGQFLLKLKIKEETYGEEQRVKITVIKADKVDYVAETRLMFDTILKHRQR